MLHKQTQDGIIWVGCKYIWTRRECVEYVRPGGVSRAVAMIRNNIVSLLISSFARLYAFDKMSRLDFQQG